MKKSGMMIGCVITALGALILLSSCGTARAKSNTQSATAAANRSGTTPPVTSDSPPAGFKLYSGTDTIIESSSAQTKSVTLNIIGGQGEAGSGFNFNGYANGDMDIRVPTGWKVKVDFSVDSSLAHSLVVAPWSERQAATFTVAFPGAAVPNYSSGIHKGDSPEHFSFTADKTGKFALVCAVPGHDDLGMFDILEVSNAIKQPAVLVK